MVARIRTLAGKGLQVPPTKWLGTLVAMLMADGLVGAAVIAGYKLALGPWLARRTAAPEPPSMEGP